MHKVWTDLYTRTTVLEGSVGKLSGSSISMARLVMWACYIHGWTLYVVVVVLRFLSPRPLTAALE